MRAPSPRRLPAVAVVALLLCGSASIAGAQAIGIAAGQTIAGRLDPSDRELDDGSFYDLYEYRGQPGEQIVITMRSVDFDAYLSGGRIDGQELIADESDDDGAGGTDSRLTVTVGSTGRYGIRANALNEGETGAYTLTVERLGGAPSAQPAGMVTITAGQTLSGRLDASDPKLADDSHYDLYVYRGQPGDRITITMRSADFDAYLAGGSLSGSTFQQDVSDDDGAGGTDARLEVTVGTEGTYVIRANSLGGGETGAYTLTVERTDGSARAPTPGVTPIAGSETVAGRLDSTDPTMGDGSHYDLYLYEGQPGEEIVVTMRSIDFDTYLSGGQMQGTDFSAETSDDDGAGGTDSRLTVTLGPSGRYALRANSLSARQTGAYTLRVQSSHGGSAALGPRVIRSGETAVGRLESSDPRLADNSHFHEYRYEGRAGERLIVTLTSNDFDAFLRWGRLNGSSFELLDSDDDAEGGTNSRLAVTIPADGLYAVQANTYAPDETGLYTLSIESTGGVPAGIPAITIGQTINASLQPSDPVLSDNSHYRLYTYQGRPGDQVLVTMRSPDFDAYLATGTLVGSSFEAELRDDDGAGGTDAQILATVGAGGLLAIQANSLSAAQTGRFTLSLQSPGGGPTGPAAGRATVAPGSRIAGALRPSDPMLGDSSYYNLYVYEGSPGDRLSITLASSDFDAYLRWGKLEGNELRADTYDDDGAGGTDARLEVTVGGTGTYALQANSYAPGETGAYTLTVERLSAGSTPASPRAPAAGSAASGSGGKWLYEYVDHPSPVYRSLSQRMKRVRVLEDLSENLNSRYLLPRNVDMRLDRCDMVNAYYSPRDTQIVFCYELLEMLSDIFAGGDQWTQEEQDAVDGAFRFIMMHEVGHALVHVLDLPITGREEDAADQLAVVTLVEHGGEKGAQAAVNGVLAIQPESNVFDDYEFADEHSLGPVRLYNVLCWIYGSNPGKYRELVNNGSLPRERADRCPGEWERMSKAWQRILQPYGAR